MIYIDQAGKVREPGPDEAKGVIGKAACKNDRQKKLSELKEFAEQMMRETVYGSEAILYEIAINPDTDKFSVQQLKEIIESAIGLASFYLIDLGSAIQLITDAANGDTRKLARYGIIIGEGLTAEEKYNLVLQKGREQIFFAKEVAKTYTGALMRLRLALGHFGRLLREEVVRPFNALGKVARKLKKQIEKN